MNTTSQEILNKLSMIQKSGGSGEINNTFETQSNASYFFNEEEMQNYEENIQQKINDIWTSVQQKQDQLQNDFQTELEDIIEDCAGIKFEKMAEIKFMYKKCDESEFAARDAELAQVKQDMEELKNKRVAEAKAKMQESKNALQKEKSHKLKELKGTFNNERPGGGGSMIGESYSYMHEASPSPNKKSKSFLCQTPTNSSPESLMNAKKNKQL